MKPPAPPAPAARPADDDAPAIDADVAELLDAAIDPLPLPPAVQARIRQRLLRRIAAETTPRHLTLAAADGVWQPFAAGVRIKVLHEQGGLMSYLLELAPGAELPPHRHPVDEECLVLAGEVRIGALRFGAGSFHLGRRDVLHDGLRSEQGALVYLRGAAPEADLLI